MKEFFSVLKNRLQNNAAAYIITVVDSSGSVPRTKGAYMLVGNEGRVYGTIGGGAMEYEAEKKAKELLSTGKNFVFDYILNEEKSAELGMVCGGSARVLFYYADKECLSAVERAETYCAENKSFKLILPFEGGNISVEICDGSANEKGIYNIEGKDCYVETFSPDGKVYIFGAGHLAQELVPLLTHLNFHCVVIDDREEFANRELFPRTERVIVTTVDNVQNSINVTSRDYIAIMTRGHIYDTEAEIFALKTDARYIGVVGSRRKSAIVNAKLKSIGFSDNELSRIVTPIGLDISSETPAEIAVSIAAQLIAVRNNH